MFGYFIIFFTILITPISVIAKHSPDSRIGIGIIMFIFSIFMANYADVKDIEEKFKKRYSKELQGDYRLIEVEGIYIIEIKRSNSWNTFSKIGNVSLYNAKKTFLKETEKFVSAEAKKHVIS